MDKSRAVQGGVWGARRGVGYNFKQGGWYRAPRRGPLNQGLKEVRELAIQMNLWGVCSWPGEQSGQRP